MQTTKLDHQTKIQLSERFLEIPPEARIKFWGRAGA